MPDQRPKKPAARPVSRDPRRREGVWTKGAGENHRSRPAERRDRETPGFGDTVRNDVIGVEDWKNSKTGFLTGYSTAKRSIATIGTSAKDSVTRTRGLFRELTRKDDVAGLDHAGGTPEERFRESMMLHGRSERDLGLILRNTYRSGRLYAILTLAGIAIALGSMVYAPPTGFISTIARFGPLPIIAALAFKHAYTNWIVRNRRLDSPFAFLKSGQFWPVGK